MATVSYVKVFNQVVDEFFRELIDTFPEEPKIKVQYNLFQTLCTTNVKKACHDFMLGSIPYLEKICMKDEDFFRGDNRPSFLSSLNFQRLWTPELSVNTKDAIWRYIKSFFTIGVKVIEMPEESLPLINYIITN
jgi:hypothetical protein